ncbi:MAG TPA: hypothetical protein QF901_03120 [Gammaproteobacteria bacterium]|nr:hypothetical protein [Gammaproteobacteria bacterium]
MSAGVLRAWLDGDRDRLVWIEFDEYAHRVFAGDGDDWLSVANAFVGGVSQAAGVVVTEVLSVDALAPYLLSLERSTDSPAAAVQAMLQLEAPRQFVFEVVDALAHRFATRADLVLKVPSPAGLLRAAGSGPEPSFDDLDDVGIGLSDVLRELSTKPFAGVLITSPEFPAADEAEAMESVASAARHYGWCVALSLDNVTTVPDELPELDLDLLLLPSVGIADLTAVSAPLGGGLGQDYWRTDNVASIPEGRRLLYGSIPADAQPELVIQRIAAALG